MLVGTSLVESTVYRTFDFVVQFLHIFASFVILLILNVVIVKTLRECHRAVRRQSNMMGLVLQLKTSIEDEERKEKLKVRSAVRTTVVLISSYLACNSLHFCLYIMEQFNTIVLQDENGNFHWLYVVLSDLVSNLFVVSSTVRLFIYYKYNNEIRIRVDEVVYRQKRILI
ncbi:hypothetical protein L596_003233 [Steinernema carpocapsae]|uniref:G-protein coupled receptors family 1 profile domain-containing protein n=1 Tax=Steinernema carpocapsae TaxID=34508 RepID=A0A4U8US24_STECR|nr:hypothetical protein L596_003233 [Steinernema carpocapsae]